MIKYKFGEFDSAEEINKTAEGLKAEGDKESLKALADENGLAMEAEDIDDYMAGAFQKFCTPIQAALGKLDIEKKDLAPEGIMIDWVGYVELLVGDSEDFAKNVKRKGKSLRGCIAALLKYSFEHQWKVPDDIVKTAGVNAGRVTLGEPAMFEAKNIIRDYYRIGGVA